jgi:hypothetical protein
MDAAMTQKGAPGESHRERERERVEDMELGVMTADDDDVPVSVHGWYGMVDVSVRSTRRICMSMFVHGGMHVSVCMYVCMQVYAGVYVCMYACGGA